jgi:hypothetical protein
VNELRETKAGQVAQPDARGSFLFPSAREPIGHDCALIGQQVAPKIAHERSDHVEMHDATEVVSW